MTNFSEEPERYDHDPDAPGNVPWARMGARERWSWAMLCLFNRLPLDASRARFNVRSNIVFATKETDEPTRSEHVDPASPNQALARRVVVSCMAQDVEWVRSRVRMIWGDRVGEIDTLVADDGAGRPRVVEAEPGRATLFGAPHQIDEPEGGTDG